MYIEPAFAGDTGELTDVDIGVGVNTGAPKDLSVRVTHAGVGATLTAQDGVGTATTFDDAAGIGITSASDPYNGSYRPVQPLSVFDGKPAQGVWTIVVKDPSTLVVGGRRRDAQTFLTWTLSYRAEGCPAAMPPCDEVGRNFDTSIGATVSGEAGTLSTRGYGVMAGVDVYLKRYHADGPETVSFTFGRSPNDRQLITNADISSGDAFVGTVFTDTASQSITAGSPPYTGAYKPVQSIGTVGQSTPDADWSFALKNRSAAAAASYRWGLRVRMAGDGCADNDGDVLLNADDNCPDAANQDQADYEGDQLGDVCDDDDDGDGVKDADDACPRGLRSFDPGGDQPDYDGDGCRDPEDADDDGDGVNDDVDACPRAIKGPGGDTDGDGCKDFEDADDDNDGVADTSDRCPLNADPAQTDTDGDGLGDACDPDADGDGVVNEADAYPLDPTRSKVDSASPPPPPPVAKPRITRLKLSKRRTRTGRKLKVTYTISTAATTQLTVFSFKKCGHDKHCKPLAEVRRTSRVDHAAATVKLTLKTKGLKPGSYRLRAVGRNASGKSVAATVAFRIVKH